MTKSIYRILLGTLALIVLIPAAGMAQTSDTASADAHANIIAPITLTWTADLDFGDIVADTTSTGTVTVDLTGVATPVTVQHLGGSAAAAFTVAGESGLAYVVTSDPSVTLVGTGVDMTATLNPDCGGCVVGTDNVVVGGTLTVGIAQAAGAYTGTFDVTVSYN